jgi:hypothetical protein
MYVKVRAFRSNCSECGSGSPGIYKYDNTVGLEDDT